MTYRHIKSKEWRRHRRLGRERTRQTDGKGASRARARVVVVVVVVVVLVVATTMRSLFSTTAKSSLASCSYKADARCASSSSSSSKSCASKKSSLRTAKSGAPTSTRDGVSPSRGRRRRRVSSASSGDWNSQMRNAEDERVGVLLLNLGGPETVDDVEPFLFNLFADPDIIRLPSASSSPRLLKRFFFFVSSLFESVAFSHSRLARSRRRKRKPSFCESSLFVSLPWSTRTTTTTTKSFSDETRATRNRGCSCSLFLSNVSRLTLRTSSPHRRCDCERTNRTKQTACNSYNSSSRRW